MFQEGLTSSWFTRALPKMAEQQRYHLHLDNTLALDLECNSRESNGLLSMVHLGEHGSI